ncbi:urease accessory protein UreF [Paenibacillus sp. Marseille-Q4541]|uniref:urease accessory protein UreF n=1 Tax=Paenibacillus sp. Marseille-Q4541 TaxID=2831522 RepID=UPI001BAC050D|nr:urease accessory protein UreF [Paenibacillus sp. Marseille-Q4541]
MTASSSLKLLKYAQLLDSALPIGGFSHSSALETYTTEGVIRTRSDLSSFIQSQLESSLTRLDGLAMKGIYQATAHHDAASIARYDKRLHAQRSSRELRESSHKMGKRLLKLARSIYPDMSFELLDTAIHLHGAVCCLPTAHAFIAYQLEIDLDEAITGHLYTAVNAYVNSALRLMPIGQTEAQKLVQELLPVIDKYWSDIRQEEPENMSSFSIAQEIYAMRHETLNARLFMS